MSLRELHRSYGALRPELDRGRLLALTTHGVLAYGAYWVRLATLPLLRSRHVDRLVRAEGLADVLDGMRQGRGQVLVLLHQGHWELAGAWAARRLGGVTTVAEVVPAHRVMARVTSRARSAAGLDVVPAGSGAAGARRLLRELTCGGAVALLADRDLADRGVAGRRVPVELGGVQTTLAAGPAELAVAAGAGLRPVTVATHGWRAPRHRVTFGPDVTLTAAAELDGPRQARVAALTQACATVLGESVRRRPSDWHLTAPLAASRRSR